MVEGSARAMTRTGMTVWRRRGLVAIMLMVAALLGILVVKAYLEEAKKEQARGDCKAWASAVLSYKSKYGDFPPDLRTVTQTQSDGTAPFRPATTLYDPWGREYQ